MNGDRQPLLHLLRIFRRTEATRQRDHLFALLGLASDAEPKALDPDYEEPLVSIVRRFARFFIERDKFSVMYHAGLGSDTSQFPSWAPDWTKPFPADSMLGQSNATERGVYNAAAGTEAQFRFEDDPDVFTPEGVRCDVIARIGRDHNIVANAEPTELLSLRMYLADAADIMASLQSYPTGEDLLEVQWRTLIANTNKQGDEIPSELGGAFVALSEIARKWKKARLLLGLSKAEPFMTMPRLFSLHC